MFSKDQFQNEIETYKRIMQINGISAMLSTFLSVYMIIYKSTSQMAEYKWHLLNISLWSAALDIYLSVIYLPTLVLPASGLCNHGLFGSFDNFQFQQFQFCFFIFLMGGFGSSICLAFTFRYSAITQTISRIHNKFSMTLIVLIHIFYSAPAWIVYLYAAEYDPAAVLKEMKEVCSVYIFYSYVDF